MFDVRGPILHSHRFRHRARARIVAATTAALWIVLLVPAACTAVPLDSLALRVLPERPREFLFTDKGGAHFYGEAANDWSRSYHGFYSHMHEFLDGWNLEFDGRRLDRIEQATVFPDRIVRDYPGLQETITLLDAAPGVAGAALVIELRAQRAGTLRFTPRADIRFVWEEIRPDYECRWDEGQRMLALASRRHLQRTAAEDWPVWLSLGCSERWEWQAQPVYETQTYAKDAARRAMARATPYEPGMLSCRMAKGRSVFIAAVLADAASAAGTRVEQVLRDHAGLSAARQARLQRLADAPGLESSDPRLTRAAAWCRVSMDQLIMRQRGLGIYAGYPWFTTYWGRDSFISLPGACLVTGDFAAARTILTTFAAHQDTDPSSRNLGRLPNFVTVNQIQYATADGTWWWVRALEQYERASGDLACADSLYPVVRNALDGALQQRVDANGFVTHGDGETWMDAGGEAHPYSPRGNRAIEVEALFANALRYGVELASRQREREDGLRWQQAHDQLVGAFEQQFFDPTSETPYDHLNADDTPDRQVRPNGLLAWFVSPGAFADGRARATIHQVRDRLAYPWSVGSLVAGDLQFRPVHLALERYFFDAAYHNGDVWLWLSGPLVSGLVALHEVDTAWRQTQFLVDEILDRGVVGSLREIRDAAESAGKDEFGGAVAQAWSLAELQRTLYETYLGVRPDLRTQRVRIEPMLPSQLVRLAADVPWGPTSALRVQHEVSQGRLRTRVTPHAGCEGAVAEIVLTAVDGTRWVGEFALQPGHTTEAWLDVTTGAHGTNGAPLAAMPPVRPPRGAAFHFQVPESPDGK